MTCRTGCYAFSQAAAADLRPEELDLEGTPVEGLDDRVLVRGAAERPNPISGLDAQLHRGRRHIPRVYQTSQMVEEAA